MEILWQKGRRRLFWMTENHFWSHFSPFQINTQIFILFWKFCHKMAAGCYFGWPKITFDRISCHFISIRNSFFYFHKMAASGHFGWPKITFDRISRHFRSIHNFFFFEFCPKVDASSHFRWTKIVHCFGKKNQNSGTFWCWTCYLSFMNDSSRIFSNEWVLFYACQVCCGCFMVA